MPWLCNPEIKEMKTVNATRTLIVGIVGAALWPALLGMAPQERGAALVPPCELWVFVSLKDEDLRADFREIARLQKEGHAFRVRPSLLADDFALMKRATQVQMENIQALRELIGKEFGLPVVDEEGLAQARALGIERVPAFALIDPKTRRAHVAYGRGARLSELFSCE